MAASASDTPGATALPLVPRQRGDAVRNRGRVLDAARRLVVDRGAAAVTMDDVAAEAGVGKGTLFRRFGSRSGLMRALLDADEQDMQRAVMFGPPPLGPDAPPLQRLLALGRQRLEFVRRHADVLCEATRDSPGWSSPAGAVLHTHVRMLLADAGAEGDLDTQADALLSLLDARYVQYQLTDRGRTPEQLGDGWAQTAMKLCSR
ncbi:MAG: TetR/AcrR family transcriptional regulator [Mycobacterium sp.]|nr:TetR/AcrR family transcriptional regulator [Mycobacterium sp.]